MDTGTALTAAAERWPGGMVASTGELREAGIDDRVITACVRAGVFYRIRRGAYAQSAQWRALGPWEQDDYRIDAHAAGAQSAAVYSHASAARLHGFAVWNAGSAVHIVRAASSGGAGHGPDTAAHRVPVGPGKAVAVSTRDGRRVLATPPERTVLDCARILTLEQAAVIGDSALRRGVTLEGLKATLESAEFARGRARAEKLLTRLDGRAESAGETRTRLLLARLGIAAPEIQFSIETPLGTYRADYAWPQVKLILEFDGRAKYFDYRPTPEALLLERQRESALIELGWRVIRLTWADLDRPDLVAARMAAAFAAAA